jgi:hypothetical protein
VTGAYNVHKHFSSTYLIALAHKRRTSLNDRLMIELGAYEIRANSLGFEALSNLHSELSQLQNSNVGIDCKRLTWIDAQLGASLLTIVNLARISGNDIAFYNIVPRIQTILKKNKTLSGGAVDVNGTTIPMTGFDANSAVEFSKFSKAQLMRRKMPRMSDGLVKKFFEGIDELFANSALWANSPTSVFAGGQFFPRLDRLAFVISDGGRGIQGSLSAAGKNFAAPEDAIDWAMEMNNSARQGDIPGGLGLGILKEFIGMNGGCLLVCSHHGYWECRNGIMKKQRIANQYPGTVVSLEINTADTNSYHMKSATNPHEIW